LNTGSSGGPSVVASGAADRLGATSQRVRRAPAGSAWVEGGARSARTGAARRVMVGYHGSQGSGCSRSDQRLDLTGTSTSCCGVPYAQTVRKAAWNRHLAGSRRTSCRTVPRPGAPSDAPVTDPSQNHLCLPHELNDPALPRTRRGCRRMERHSARSDRGGDSTRIGGTVAREVVARESRTAADVEALDGGELRQRVDDLRRWSLSSVVASDLRRSSC